MICVFERRRNRDSDTASFSAGHHDIDSFQSFFSIQYTHMRVTGTRTIGALNFTTGVYEHLGWTVQTVTFVWWQV